MKEHFLEFTSKSTRKIEKVRVKASAVTHVEQPCSCSAIGCIIYVNATAIPVQEPYSTVCLMVETALA